jgi:hypothetical protein
MKPFGAVLVSALLVAGCSQVIDQFYSKTNFDAQSFHADIAECKKRSPSFVTIRANAVEQTGQVDDSMVGECMKAKGYMMQPETR